MGWATTIDEELATAKVGAGDTAFDHCVEMDTCETGVVFHFHRSYPEGRATPWLSVSQTLLPVLLQEPSPLPPALLQQC
jgi:hypothetical protein